MNNARYTVDFHVMPNLIRSVGADFVHRSRTLREEFVCLIFDSFLTRVSGEEHHSCTPNQFRVTEHPICGETKLLYIELPPASEGETLWCTAYAIAFSDAPEGIRDVQLYTVERSALGTGCIGAMTPDGHVNYGLSFPTVSENVEAIRRLLSGTED